MANTEQKEPFRSITEIRREYYQRDPALNTEEAWAEYKKKIKVSGYPLFADQSPTETTDAEVNLG